ncbi:MAG: PRC-barrel domain-containing protein [Erythrobacter sp.]|uniref:PRC-barrel domain-containing protein n=1 Tax=Erythrobacter sp. HL-111 TaxID=1798193 RepID=UPI0006DADDCF|nr:PRC-barrel domain-containing protein [Erythrobacter sp. HL-111]KPP94977.1 MAG: PRC-barrel domain [Erythrobacteraceae bacterium HL-111]SDS13824.1 PRC-barrel domain-containing protein [Erythrobacter sp. HL-111]
MNTDDYVDLADLDDYRLENSDQDLRGHGLYSTDGTRLGTIRRMLVDPEREHVAALVLDDGRGVPVSEIEIRRGEAYIDPVEESRWFRTRDTRRDVERGPVPVRRRDHPRGPV